ncbi:hypothetical protein [Denitrobaculum tricleocarpae]|uniref:hypothetical protein n=1 Tax=Denitrobaculum tricleocarpae TaxID=2591009 RepID=UPI001C553512|nr:hypothetical protein [Denitrobaculum tricleocarpae]
MEQPEPPWGLDGKTATFDICACCGAEFGYEDSLYSAVVSYREEWKRKGMNWWSEKDKPEDWDVKAQLSNIPAEYL